MLPRVFVLVDLGLQMENKEKVIIEVGSTVTKVDLYVNEVVTRINEKTIFFKKHYKEEQKINANDVDLLVQLVNSLSYPKDSIYVCGTSIFRDLKEKEKEAFCDHFKRETGLDFEIVSQERESELTVLGATRCVHEKVCVFIGGGGSTEIAIYEDTIKESANSFIGVMDILALFPDLANDVASTSLEDVMAYIKEKITLPKEKADVLILAGGGHEKFARYSGIKYEENKIYQDVCAPIMMDMETRKKETKRYFEKISLEEIKKRVEDPNWWEATRAMCAFVLVVAEAIGAKYIVPTNIGMVYGIIEELQ